jgi:Tfp pilus assembly protein PilN
MLRAALDFNHEPKNRTSKIWLLLGGALLVASAVHYQGLVTSLHEAQQEWNTRGQRDTKAAKSPKPAELKPMQQAAIRSLSLNWGPLFDAVEAATTTKVALLAMEPDASKGTVRLNLEAKDKRAMQDYVQGLAARRGLNQVSLLSQETQLENPLLPIRFSVGAAWQQ